MIVIPAAGQSSRFKAEGIKTPKFKLPLWSGTVFDRVLHGFRAYAASEDFLIVTKDDKQDVDFFHETLTAHQIHSYEILTDDHTRGMIPGVAEGLKKTRFSLDQPLLIHPTDLFYQRVEIPRPNCLTFTADFIDARDNNFSRKHQNTLQIALRHRGTGVYHLNSARDFTKIYAQAATPTIRRVLGEKAMEVTEAAGLLTRLHLHGYRIHPRLIPAQNITECGTPAQYHTLQNACEPG